MNFNPFGKPKSKEESLKVYLFTKKRRFHYEEVFPDVKENNQIFKFKSEEYKEGIYVVDIASVQFFTGDKKPIYFYIEGIPNPIRFDLKKYIERFITARRNNPDTLVYDDNKNLLDVSFSSSALEFYKNDNFLKKLQGKISPEYMKIIMFCLILVGIAFATIIIIVLFKH